jgi:hypothetical protein
MAGLIGTKSGTELRSPLRLFKPAYSHLGSNVGAKDIVTAVDFVHLSLTSAQIKALSASPILAIKPPTPPGTGIVIDDVTANYKYGTTQYAAGGAIQVGYGAGLSVIAASIAATFLTAPVANQAIKVIGSLASNLSSAVLNQGVYINNATGAFTTGDGTLDLWIFYTRLPMV